MKYYLYIPDAKIDMLDPQVPHPAKEKFARQFGFDLKFLSASRRTETEVEDNRVNRLLPTDVPSRFVQLSVMSFLILFALCSFASAQSSSNVSVSLIFVREH